MPRLKRKPTKKAVCEKASYKRIKRKHVTPAQDRIQILRTTSEYLYRLGDIIITLQEVHHTNTSDIFLHFNSDNKYFLQWEEIDEFSEIQEVFCPVTCETPYEILKHLSVVKTFYFIIHSDALNPGDNVLYIYIKPAKFVQIQYASQPYINHERFHLYRILNFFLNVEFEDSYILDYENLYASDEEQVQKLYKCICNSYNSEFSNISVTHDYLIPCLRKYQMQAAYWMLEQERGNSINTSNLHVLYSELILKDGSCVFFNKYGGFFVREKFLPQTKCKGGILADEMGLGKTLEVLACILLNPRNDNLKQENSISLSAKPIDDATIAEHSSGKKNVKISFSEDLHWLNLKLEDFKCVCGSLDYSCESKSLIICEQCQVLQHAECLLYKPDITDDEYICPHCWMNKPDLLCSSATLIVSPSAIIDQWEQEISRHIKKNCLRVFMYLGVEVQKYIDPKFLANHDIVLTSYEIFKKELDHANIQNDNTGIALRHPKKYLSIPSPLCTIQWWRICLDEAQMVESVNSKISKMAAKLQSINRWCITGTPIQKSVDDLYGLLLFLDFDPYQEKLWWKEILWKPFINGKTSNISFVLKQIAWRSTKRQVLDQIGLPGLEEVIHKVDFSPIERVFYEKQHVNCRKDLIDKLEKTALDLKLKSVDKHFLSKLLLPLRRLQQICCHFQITHGNLFDAQKNKMTMEELLDRLLKSAKYESEDIHRKLIMSMNGLAGIYAIEKNFESATETYTKVLDSIEENSTFIRTDTTQQIHALFHLSKILSMHPMLDGNQINHCFTPQQLDEKMKELCETYILKHKNAVDLCKKNVDEIGKEILTTFRNFKLSNVKFPTSVWWSVIIQDMQKDEMELFFLKLGEILKSTSVKNYLRFEHSMIDSFEKAKFLTVLYEKSKELYDIRLKLRNKVESISVEPNASVMNAAISCHLRPFSNERTKCEYCEAESIFQTYETKLFRFDESENTSDENSICFQPVRRGTHADSEFELALKWILNFSRRRQNSSKYIEDGMNELKLIEALKKEFKFLRTLWLKCNEYISQKDEIEMAKISARVLLPGESPPNPPLPYVLLPQEIQPKLIQYHSDIISFQFELKKKKGHLFYLENLKKAENKDNPFEENCPVCRQKFENTWSVLQCGHSFCLICIQRLLNCKQKFRNSLGYNLEGIRCALCREWTACSDVYCIDNSNKMDNSNDIPVKGSYSAKVIAVVKCLLHISKSDPGAKSLVFTSFADFLYILEHALLQNNINCLNLCKKKYFKDRLEKFKRSTDVNVLLIPLDFGCNGLNITEATHVLLLEPVLDYSKHLQAIGRVHRIGQMKLATVHKFIVSNSIDENIHIINENYSTSDIFIQDLTIRDLKHLFES